MKFNEEKKMFTKNDLKNGDVIVQRNGWVEIVIVDLDVLISKDGWDNLNDIAEDLTDVDADSTLFGEEYDIVKVYRPTNKWDCSFEPDSYEKGTLVYDRERDFKPLYNGKVVCIDNTGNINLHTIGKIYQFENGQLTADDGPKFPWSHERAVHSFEEWQNRTASKFIEVVE